MTIEELRQAIADLAGDAPVVAIYEANCCESDNVAVALVDGRLVINCDGADYL